MSHVKITKTDSSRKTNGRTWLGMGAASLVCLAIYAEEFPVLSQIFTAGNACGVAFNETNSQLTLSQCDAFELITYSEEGEELNRIPTPSDIRADATDVDIAPEAFFLSDTLVPAGSVLYLHGEEPTEIYALDPNDSTVIAKLEPEFGDGSVVGAAFHPTNRSLFLVQTFGAFGPNSDQGNRVAEVDTRTGRVLSSFQVDEDFGPNFRVSRGDIDVCHSSGNLIVISSIQDFFREFTTTGQLVAEHQLPPVAGSTSSTLGPLSGLAIDNGRAGEAWVQNDGGDAFRISNLPCGTFERGLVASVLPAGRSVQVNEPATGFASMINTSTEVGTSCGIAPLTSVPGSFSFQTTDPLTNALTGVANQLVDIAPGATQTYAFAFTPDAEFEATEVRLSFQCDNFPNANVVLGLNSLVLSASVDPVPDVIALGATPTQDGVVRLDGTGVFSVATANVGSTAIVSVTVNTGASSLPITLSVCETDPITSVCLEPPVDGELGMMTTAGEDSTQTFGIFLSIPAGEEVGFDPANTRVFVNFSDETGVLRGATSVAVTTTI